jgi:hypothetical protein
MKKSMICGVDDIYRHREFLNSGAKLRCLAVLVGGAPPYSCLLVGSAHPTVILVTVPALPMWVFPPILPVVNPYCLKSVFVR